MKSGKIRVLVVDDSIVIRSFLRAGLARHPQLEVVGIAADGIDALAKIDALRPDVVTLDIEMPRLEGLGVLERAAGEVAVAFVMVSTLTQSGARVTFEALQKGAVDYVTKPAATGKTALPDFQEQLAAKVIAAARVRNRRLLGPVGARGGAIPRLPPVRARGGVVAIGISCGGPQTLHQLLPAFPGDFVPIVVTQHMPPQFTGPFARHLAASCAMDVREARDGEPLEPGAILIAPGDRHLRLKRMGTQVRVSLDSGPPVSGHRPSVDAMFASVASACGPRAVGVIMTGMGRDGAQGIVELARAGARTIAQDESSCYVYGMPKAAVATGAVGQVVPLAQMPARIAECLEELAAPPRGAARSAPGVR